MNAEAGRQGLVTDITRRVIQVFVTLGIQALVLFLSAGKVNWLWGWVYILLNLLGILMVGVFIMRHNPEMIAERGKTEGMRDWDRVIGGLWGIFYFIGILVVAGLDERFAWTGALSPALRTAGVLSFLAGFVLFFWAMLANAFFSAVARIQDDRGQQVCTTGPYRFVRHPGYVGAILQSLGAPLLLGSTWALIPGVISAALMIVRTALEDRMLREELHGYQEYAGQVRYRLLPGVW